MTAQNPTYASVLISEEIQVEVTPCVMSSYEFDSSDTHLAQVDYIAGDVAIYRILPNII